MFSLRGAAYSGEHGPVVVREELLDVSADSGERIVRLRKLSSQTPC